MSKYMQTEHSSTHKEYLSNHSSNNQSTLTAEDFKLKELSVEKSKLITHAIANFIAIDMRAISVVDGLGFQRLVQILEPRYKIPPRQTFSQQVIPKKYQDLKSRLEINLKNIEGYSRHVANSLIF